MTTLHGKKVFITGASSGIGASTALKVAAQGALPVLLARRYDQLKNIALNIEEQTGVQSLFYSVDVSDEGQVKHVFEKIEKEIGFCDILVNNAGFGVFEHVKDSSLENIRSMFEVNVFGLIACTQAVLPHMLEANRGHIINVVSQAGKLATPKSSGYAASKHAALGFTNSLRLELSDTNINVSTVNFGPVDTNFFSHADPSGSYVKNVKRWMLTSEQASEAIVRVMMKQNREVNLPRWMGIGAKLYQLAPHLFEKVAGNAFKMK
ncbi:SDR family NAD(P)-dependent oxidoreductase [Bacillus solimangrovi]|uniref:Oxidoreductase n=1 Tax=Bacillus solimangrovi TaxID=1305675 RepID=A0A1E5LKE2_9BACI|nr:SDR family oxidoreductase [Bacillus solimangrovi]OEH94573.1 oxidoreductase [Bacillus solimangrovi]